MFSNTYWGSSHNDQVYVFKQVFSFPKRLRWNLNFEFLGDFDIKNVSGKFRIAKNQRQFRNWSLLRDVLDWFSINNLEEN